MMAAGLLGIFVLSGEERGGAGRVGVGKGPGQWGRKHSMFIKSPEREPSAEMKV